MKNFKEIAEKCLSGELSGTFVTAFGNNWHSNYLQKPTIFGHEIPGQYVLGPGVIYNEIGQCESRKHVKIIDFIPDNMAEQIKIDVPEGKIPVMEQTDNGVVITWKEKELTYEDVCKELQKHRNIIGNPIDNSLSDAFHKKVWTLRKLTNIRNYFGKPKVSYDGVVITCEFGEPIIVSAKVCPIECLVIFAEKEHAEQAIKMLGDELKYLFEPW